MTLVIRSLTFHWRTNLTVLFGVAAAGAVLAGALVVGDSVRGSLREIALGRLGRTEKIVSTPTFVRAEVADTLQRLTPTASAAPLVIALASVTHEPSRRRASGVQVYGVDRRFWAFHGLPDADGVYVSPALAAELGVQPGDALLARVQKPQQIPIESLFGRKEDIGRTLRLQATGVLGRDRLGEFALQPQQTAVRAIFAPLTRVQRDLGVPGLVNTVLLAGVGEAPIDAALELEDLGVRVTQIAEPDGRAMIAVDTDSGILNAAVEQSARRVGERLKLGMLPLFTYLANTIRNGDREVPYSLVTAMDLSALPATGTSATSGRDADAIVLNEWTARELAAVPGDRVELDYYTWESAAGLQSRSAAFTVAAVVPIAGIAADRRLAPEYPGITAAENLADWDPPFPIDLSRVRPADEAYWHQFRTTPKVFVSYERGRDLWGSRYGAFTSLRFVPADGAKADDLASVRRSLRSELTAAAMDVRISPVRTLAVTASAGATDFGEYFTYFSFFIVVSALLLVVIFFKLGVEQRLRQTGILRASGFTMADIRRLTLAEGLAIAVAGGALGAAGAILYARLIVHGLRTWWVGAVGTTELQVHVSALSLLAGAVGGVAASAICIFLSMRSVGRLTPRALLQAQTIDLDRTARSGGGWRRWTAAALALAALSMAGWGFVSRAAQAGAFFGAGGASLIAILLAFSAWLRARDRRPIAPGGAWAIARLGFRNATARPGRSVLSAALIASATFLIFSIDAFRRGADEISLDPRSSSGGYALLAESDLPILADPNTASGRDALLIDGPEIGRTRIARFRLRKGQDASCLNLFRPNSPTLIAPAPGFTEAGRFTFSESIATTEAERANPWQLLDRTFPDGAVPAIADATSLQYALHAAVGDTFAVDVGGHTPLQLRFVAALSDSVLQGEVIIAEHRFTTIFPAQQGYQFFLIEDPSVRTSAQATALAGVFERELQEFGVDAVGTGERLAAYHRVENTYLSTFQALGGLGLLLGTFGLMAVMFRNVLERRRELALLRAVGYSGGKISLLMLSEAVLLLGAGLAIGAVSAALAVTPAWLNRGGSRPGSGLVILLAIVVLTGLASAHLAARAAASGRLVEALKTE